MTVTLYRKDVKSYHFICTKILGQEITFDKQATARLKELGAKPGTFDIDDTKFTIYATQNGKFCNLHIGVPKEKSTESDNADDLPF